MDFNSAPKSGKPKSKEQVWVEKEQVWVEYEDLIRWQFIAEMQLRREEARLEKLRQEDPANPSIKKMEEKIAALDAGCSYLLGQITLFEYSYVDGLKNSNERVASIHKQVGEETGYKPFS